MYGSIDINTKTNTDDLVTSLDKGTEKFFHKKIKETYPDHSLFSEEGFGDHITSIKGTLWIIDPIDGTINFVHQKRNFAISIGIFQDGVGEIGFIYDVMRDVLYFAKRGEGAFRGKEKLQMKQTEVPFQEALLSLNHYWLCENDLVAPRVMQSLVKNVRGTRTIGAAALEFASVAEGSLNGYLSLNLAPWDIAGGLIIIEEAGGVVTNHLGEEINLLNRSSVVACHKNIHTEVIEYLRKGRK